MDSINPPRSYSTMRPINAFLFFLLMAGFGALAIYFGFLLTPFIWNGKGAVIELPDMSYALVLMLGAIGIAGFVISSYGFVVSILSIVKRNDNYTVKAFASYISIGYVLCIALLLNAVWLYRLTTTNYGYNEFGFVITLYVIALIVLLIATNVPLVKLYGEEKNSGKTMRVITGAAAAINFGIALPFFLSYLNAVNVGIFNYSSVVTMKFGIYALIAFIAFILSFSSFIVFGQADKKNEESVLGFSLFGVTSLADAGALITCGVFAQIYSDKKVSFMAKKIGEVFEYSTEFAIMSYIIGILLFIGVVFVVIYSLTPHKKKTAEVNF